MTWVVDTCVLIDILKVEPLFSKQSSQALAAEIINAGLPESERVPILPMP